MESLGGATGSLVSVMGGDIGITFVTTLAARRAQFHQARLTEHTTAYDHPFMASLAATARAMERAGASSSDAARRALAALYRETIIQATTLAYLDVLRVLAYMTALMIPILLIARRGHAPPAGAAAAGH